MLEGSILKRLMDQPPANDAEATDRDPTPLNFGVYYKNTLVALCHALEDCILAADCNPLVVTAFQRGQWYLQEADRYRDIAECAADVVIMACPDAGFHSHPTSQHPNVHLVDLKADDPVAQEWHLMILSPSYSAMVLCQELLPEDYGPAGPPKNDLERKFYGFWTFEPHQVQKTIALAIDHIGQYDSALQANLQAHLDRIRQQTDSMDAAQADAGLGEAVTRVVEYLQGSRQSLLTEGAFSLAEALDQNLVSNELQAFLRMAQLVDVSDPSNPLATREVASLLEMMGQLLDLPAWQLQRLRLAGLLHRVAPFQSDAVSPTDLGAPSCPLVPGAQVLRTMPRLRAVATIITHQTENWDGSGQPAGLKGDQIPLESRMLGLSSTFQQRLNEARQGNADAELTDLLGPVFATLEAEQESRWDPKLVEMLGLMVAGLQQGLSLPSIPMRFTLGTGLLNPEIEIDPGTGTASYAEV